MTRRARLALDRVSTHVVRRGTDRDACFFGDDDRLNCLALLAEIAPEAGCAVHAYALTTNHVHLLVTPKRAAGVSHLMRAFDQRAVQAIKRAYRRSFTPWEGRLRSCPVDDDTYLPTCQRHIELNPVRAALVRDPLEPSMVQPSDERQHLAIDAQDPARDVSRPRSGRAEPRVGVSGHRRPGDARRRHRRDPARHRRQLRPGKPPVPGEGRTHARPPGRPGHSRAAAAGAVRRGRRDPGLAHSVPGRLRGDRCRHPVHVCPDHASA